MYTDSKERIIQCWKSGVEDTLYYGQLELILDGDYVRLSNCNAQCFIDVWRNSIYMGSYTHIESLLFDLECLYCPTAIGACIVKPSKKRKR